jgi:hypothetical protein
MTESAPVNKPRYLRRVEAARYIRDTWGIPCSPKTLAKLAVVGGGPLFRKCGPYPLHQICDLDAWCSARVGPKQRSTSDPGDGYSDLGPT